MLMSEPWEREKTGMKEIRCKVLFLASWYPSRVHPAYGIFIKKHAEAAAKYCDVAVLYVTPDPNMKDKTYDIEYTKENGVHTVRVYHRTGDFKLGVISKLFNKLKLIRHIISLKLQKPIHPSPTSPGLVWYIIGLKLIKERFGRPDVVHVNVVSRYVGMIALILKYSRGIPYIITEHWTGYTERGDFFSNLSTYEKLLIKLIFKNAKAVSAVSKHLIAALKKHGLVNDNYFITPNVVDIPQDICPDKNDDSRIRALTISGLLDRSKNISGLIRAFSSVVHRYNNVELHIVGDGEDKGRLENIAKDLGLLNKNVFFHGYIPNNELYRYLAQTNFFVLNSNYETFSVATAEAVAHGVPVVVTRSGGPEEFVTKDVGVLTEPENPKQLEEAILYMLDNWSKYDRKKLKEYAKNKFSHEVVGEKLDDIYRKTIGAQ